VSLLELPNMAFCRAATRGLSGGVSIADGAVRTFSRPSNPSPLSFNIEPELALRDMPAIALVGSVECEPELGCRSLTSFSPKHDGQPTGNASDTIIIVGP